MRDPLPWDAVEREFRAMFERRYFANNGPLVQKFDERFAKSVGAAHAIACANAPVALALAAKALARSGEVLVPHDLGTPFREALAWAGLRPTGHQSVQTTLVISTSAATMEHAAGARYITCVTDVAFKAHDAQSDATIYCLDLGIASGGALGASIATDRSDLSDQLKTMRNFHATETFADVPLRMNAKMSESQAALALVALEVWLASA